MSVLLKNGFVYQTNVFKKADILVEGEQIKAIGNLDFISKDVDEIDLSGKYIVPGLIDVHVHYRDPGLTYKEDVHSGSMAAAHGGFTTVCAMANVDPVPNSLELIKKMMNYNKTAGVVHIKQFAPITEDLTSDKLIDYQAMQEAGVCGFSNDGYGIQKGKTMFDAMRGIRETGLPLAEHVEDDSLKFNGVMNAGQRAGKLGLQGIPGVCESSQLARDLLLAKQTGVHYHVCHVSTKESVAMIRIAKQMGINVTCEVAPHHLLLNEEMITKDDADYKMNPPLRTKEDQEALIEGLKDGTIDLIATDHAPHASFEKQHGMKEGAFGITGSETAFASLYTKFVKSDVFKLSQLINWLTVKPANVYHLSEAGMLKIGDQADLTVFDLNQSFKLGEDDFYSKGKNTPFINQEFYGKTILTMVSGKIVYHAEGEN
ncbi:MAG TPA: dihydroorotase [Candidatus Ligilactobacillus excrementigallinarum]|uniref:Dihydroorotase n=1 Tax=Candidatus Ligilactobacillus excrementigallinarum TaxID=2838641 RepID=A0A9D2AB37_9LACO|nr:dihydroorotase [Candidatus Ligilactobacillus excrementigallinarum]